MEKGVLNRGRINPKSLLMHETDNEQDEQKQHDGKGPNLRKNHNIVDLSTVDTITYLRKHNFTEVSNLIIDLLQLHIAFDGVHYSRWKDILRSKFERLPAKQIQRGERSSYPLLDNRHFQALLWAEQCLISLPLLFFASIYLFIYAESRGIKYYLFAQRDSVHFYRIFKLLFPFTNTCFFAASRNLFYSSEREFNQDYLDYVSANTGGLKLNETIFIDIHGSGRSASTYFTSIREHTEPINAFPHIFLLTARWSKVTTLPVFAQKLYEAEKYHCVAMGTKASSLEILNYALEGSIVGFKKGKCLRLPLEYDIKPVLIYHAAVDEFLALLGPQLGKSWVKRVQSIPKEFPTPYTDSYREIIIHFASFMVNRPVSALTLPLIKHHATTTDTDDTEVDEGVD